MSGKNPKYFQVIEWVRKGISEGELRQGDRLKTEYELSEMFGISRQTVRRAIGELENDHVLTRIQGSGTYVGNGLRIPHRERHMNIAVISTYIDTYIFPRTIHGFEKILSKHGYTTQISFTNDNIYREFKILENILDKDNIDGMIVEPSKSALPNPNIKYYRELAEKQIPILFFNSVYPGLDMPCVSLDDRAVSKRAANLLISAGHRKIGGIFKLDDGQGHQRYAGYQEALGEAGIPMDDRRVCWFDSENLRDFAKLESYLIDRLEDCTAVECYNDEMAYQLTNACIRRGIRIPDDLSIVGIDNSELAERAAVPFTSFPHPMEELGRRAAENLVRMIENPGFDGNYKFRSEAVLRNSVRTIETR